MFRFWTFLKNTGAQGLFGALDVTNTPCAKKIQKFYHYPIAHGGLISMPILLEGESPHDVIFVLNYHNLSFKTDRFVRASCDSHLVKSVKVTDT